MYIVRWMQNSINQIYNQIKDIKTKKEFENEIKSKQQEYDFLLNQETVALLIADELGRNQQNITKISDLKYDTETTVYARVKSIGEMRNFNRKNGSSGRVINLDISDNTGTCGLALWDDDVELVIKKIIKKGSNLKIINGYIKKGFKGLEVNSGRWSIIEVEPEDMPDFKEEKINNSKEEINGKLVEIESTRPFFKDDGGYGFVTNIKIETDEGIKQLTVWDEKVKELQKFKAGDQIKIKNIDIRNKNNILEMHLNGRGVIIKI